MNLKGKFLEMVRAMDDDELWGFIQPLIFDGDSDAPKAAKVASAPAEGKRGPGRPKKVIDKDEDDAPTPKKRGPKPKAKVEAKSNGKSNGASDMTKAILKVVMKGGCSVSDVAGKVGEDKAKVAAALKALVAAGEIAKAGERRFTRYGADSKAAKAASLAARGK
jgi:hypothetical protein